MELLVLKIHFLVEYYDNILILFIYRSIRIKNFKFRRTTIFILNVNGLKRFILFDTLVLSFKVATVFPYFVSTCAVKL